MSSFSYSSTSYSSSSSTADGRTTSHAYSTEQHSDPSGSTIRHTTQSNGRPAVQETRYYDATGRELPANAAGRRLEADSTGNSHRIAAVEDVTDKEDQIGRSDGYRPPQSGETEADRQYRDRMEDEYAKREGGA